jgi:hypothetical protein
VLSEIKADLHFTDRAPAEAALPASLFSCFRELDPLSRNFKPRLLIEQASSPFGVLPGFFGLLAESGRVGFGHARI